MANTLDMSLDDLIKSRKGGETGRGRGGGQGRGRGQGRGGPVGGRGWGRGRGQGRGGSFVPRKEGGVPPRGPLRVNARPSAFSIAKSFGRAKDLVWQHDLFNDSMRAVGLTGIEIGTKLYISNLDFGVSNEDIKELFSEVGELKRCTLHYDRHGRSSGLAEVVFDKRSDSLAAMKRYNNVHLDGKPMKIEIIGTNAGAPGPLSARVNVVGGPNGRGKRIVTVMPGGKAVASSSFSRGARRGAGGFKRGRRGRGRGHGRGRKQPVQKSADDLDKELDNYHADAMQT